MSANLKKLIFSLGVLPFLIHAKHPAHQSDATPFKVIGGFNVINPGDISPMNEGLRVNRYGTTTLLKSGEENAGPLLDPVTKKEIIIRDQHYQLFDFTQSPLSKWVENISDRPSLGYGIRFLPAVRGFKSENTVNAGRVAIKGSQSVDAYLRNTVYGYNSTATAAAPRQKRENAAAPANGDSKSQPIFAMINYLHPEGFQGEAFSLAGEPNLKTEMGFTHMGLYLGDGKTVNSPARYHGDSWWDEDQANYPALLSVMDFSGLVKDGAFNVKTFNQNGIMSALVLNETNGGPEFPDEYSYKFDPVNSNTLEKVLDFYARVLRNDPTLKTDNLYKEYCAEHATQIINVLLNLPQNLTGYTDVYGPTQGAELFELAIDKIYNSELRSGAEAEWIRDAYLGNEEQYRRQSAGMSLTPYWKKLGIAAPVMQPLSNGNFAARDPKLKEAGYSLGWAPETVADLLKDFVQAYLPWTRVGSMTSVSAILGFSPEAKQRMNIDTLQFVKVITPIVQQIFLHEAAMEKGFTLLGTVNANTEAEEFAKFQARRTQRATELQGTMTAMVKRMQSGEFERDVRIDAKTASEINTISGTFMDLVKGSGTITQDAGWLRVSAKTKESLTALRPLAPNLGVNEVQISYRDSIYDREFLTTVQPMLDALNKIDPNPTDALTVKYYFAPAVSVRVAMGIHDAKSPARKDVRLWPVGHVIQANETRAIDGNTSARINDALSIEQSVF